MQERNNTPIMRFVLSTMGLSKTNINSLLARCMYAIFFFKNVPKAIINTSKQQWIKRLLSAFTNILLLISLSFYAFLLFKIKVMQIAHLLAQNLMKRIYI